MRYVEVKLIVSPYFDGVFYFWAEVLEFASDVGKCDGSLSTVKLPPNGIEPKTFKKANDVDEYERAIIYGRWDDVLASVRVRTHHTSTII